MRCSQCGKENEPGKKFCVQCGTPLFADSGNERYYTGTRETGITGFPAEKNEILSNIMRFLTDGLSRKKKALIILILILVLILTAGVNVALVLLHFDEEGIPVGNWVLNHEEVAYENGVSSEIVESVSWK